MTSRLGCAACLVLAVGVVTPHRVLAGQPAQRDPFAGVQPFYQACARCHGDRGVERAPDVATLRQMSPEKIYRALTSGTMRVQAGGLSDADKRSIAEYLSARPLGMAGVAEAKAMANQCKANALGSGVEAMPSWNGWGVDERNTRFQPAEAAGMLPNQVAGLKLKWAFGFPGVAEVLGQPTIALGRIFLGVDNGYVYSLDQESGCVYWSFAAQAAVRGAISVAAESGSTSGYGVYFGDLKGNVYALDAATGKQQWMMAVDNHICARITGAPKTFGERLYVPVSSFEEATAANPNYPCCTFRGSVVALDRKTRQTAWKTYTIPEPVRTRKNAAGVQLWAPSGGGIWSSPTIDTRRHAIYVATGDAYSGHAPKTTDAIMALDPDSGAVLWSRQDTENDTWVAGCGPDDKTGNCPEALGPDSDFGGSAILATLDGGRQILVAGQKSGIVWAHDPDRKGAVLWKTAVTDKPPGPSGELVFGGAADTRNAYFGMNSGGLIALRLATGEPAWFTPLEPAPGRRRGEGGAITAIPGVVFSAGWDGVVRAVTADSGKILWHYDTVRTFETVNHVPAKGGSMGAAGVTVAGGMVFVGSGYIGVQNGMPGNVLLAFSVN